MSASLSVCCLLLCKDYLLENHGSDLKFIFQMGGEKERSHWIHLPFDFSGNTSFLQEPPGHH